MSEPTPSNAKQYGLDGIFTLALSSAVVVSTLGLTLAWQLRHVLQLARTAPTDTAGDIALVLGMRLRDETVVADFAQRLRRAKALYDAGRCGRVLVVGGHTGGARVSEAACGRAFLLDLGMPADAILTEERSRHTLENLAHTRAMLADGEGVPALILISNRYHLARSSTLAHGLGLRHDVCGAEERLALPPAVAARLLVEAFYLHWYHVGRTWSILTRNRHSLRRIT